MINSSFGTGMDIMQSVCASLRRTQMRSFDFDLIADGIIRHFMRHKVTHRFVILLHIDAKNTVNAIRSKTFDHASRGYSGRVSRKSTRTPNIGGSDKVERSNINEVWQSQIQIDPTKCNFGHL
jgi:hypothetical protein